MGSPFAQRAALLCVLVSALAAPLEAQTVTAGDPGAAARIQYGPFGLTPRIGVTNLGIDTNVFNSAGQQDHDFTFSIQPGADAFLRVGRVRLASTTEVDYSYFQKSASQRSLNFSQDGRIEVDLIHLIPFASGAYVRTRQRPNLEIDERVQQITKTAVFGSLVPIGSRSRLDVEVRREQLGMGEGEHGSADLALALNRTSLDIAISGRRELTALTTLIVRSVIRRDRFEFSPLRDSDRLLVDGGVEIKASALLSGQAFIGFERFAPQQAIVPDYTGMIAAVSMRYTVRDTTRLGGSFDRDVDYSFEATQPYFVNTSVEADIAQTIGSAWTVEGRVGRSVLDYRSLEPATGAAALPPRRDFVDTFGVGVSRKIGRLLNAGVDADWTRRSSVRDDRTYSGMKLVGFVTYGY